MFSVHKDILTKSEYFRKALDGDFREAEEQAIDLPEEDPAIFSFIIAYLYEEKFVPVKTLSTALSTFQSRLLARILLRMGSSSRPGQRKGERNRRAKLRER